MALDTRLHHGTAELDGTLYVEIRAGPHAGACWQPDSWYVEERTFDIVAGGILRRHVPG